MERIIMHPVGLKRRKALCERSVISLLVDHHLARTLYHRDIRSEGRCEEDSSLECWASTIRHGASGGVNGPCNRVGDVTKAAVETRTCVWGV